MRITATKNTINVGGYKVRLPKFCHLGIIDVNVKTKQDECITSVFDAGNYTVKVRLHVWSDCVKVQLEALHKDDPYYKFYRNHYFSVPL